MTVIGTVLFQKANDRTFEIMLLKGYIVDKIDPALGKLFWMGAVYRNTVSSDQMSPRGGQEKTNKDYIRAILVYFCSLGPPGSPENA